MSSIEIPVIAGDGIGPEITAAVLRVVEAAVGKTGLKLEWISVAAGLSALEEGSELIPQRTMDEISRCGVALKGPCTTPVGEGFTSINVRLRKAFNLYAAVRPVRSMPGVETRYKDVDLIIIRENTEGLYSGVENEVTPGVVMSMKVASEAACQRAWGQQSVGSWSISPRGEGYGLLRETLAAHPVLHDPRDRGVRSGDRRKPIGRPQ